MKIYYRFVCLYLLSSIAPSTQLSGQEATKISRTNKLQINILALIPDNVYPLLSANDIDILYSSNIRDTKYWLRFGYVVDLDDLNFEVDRPFYSPINQLDIQSKAQKHTLTFGVEQIIEKKLGHEFNFALDIFASAGIEDRTEVTRPLIFGPEQQMIGVGMISQSTNSEISTYEAGVISTIGYAHSIGHGLYLFADTRFLFGIAELDKRNNTDLLTSQTSEDNRVFAPSDSQISLRAGLQFRF